MVHNNEIFKHRNACSQQTVLYKIESDVLIVLL